MPSIHAIDLIEFNYYFVRHSRKVWGLYPSHSGDIPHVRSGHRLTFVRRHFRWETLGFTAEYLPIPLPANSVQAICGVCLWSAQTLARINASR
jgi:hypothetical protein